MTDSAICLQIMLYNRALKPALLDFAQQENLSIHQVVLTDDYIEYSIWYHLDQIIAIYHLKSLLEDASQSFSESIASLSHWDPLSVSKV
ncbi:MAG: hypothetical protein ABI835_11200 [Chloroflexota bacterium]